MSTPHNPLRVHAAPEFELILPVHAYKPPDYVPLGVIADAPSRDLERYTNIALNRLERYFDEPAAEQSVPVEAVEVSHRFAWKSRASEVPKQYHLQGLLFRELVGGLACYRLVSANPQGDRVEIFQTELGVTHTQYADVAERREALAHFIRRVHLIDEKLTPAFVPSP